MPPTPSFRRDVASAYAASASRILSWVIVSAVVFRRSSDAFAIFALVRGTLGVLNYASLGLLPALIRAFATGCRAEPADRQHILDVELAPTNSGDTPSSHPVGALPLAYWNSPLTADSATQRLYGSGKGIATATALVGALALAAVIPLYARLYRIPLGVDPEDVQRLVALFGFGIVFRWFSEPESALLQTRDRITLDNLIIVGGEVIWTTASIALLTIAQRDEILVCVGFAFLVSSIAIVLIRGYAAHATSLVSAWKGFDRTLAAPLLLTGSLITLAQLADYLYAPTDYLLINHLLTSTDLTNYAPAMQIDSGLLLLVSGLASVLLPRAALAHAAGDVRSVRRDYLLATLASAALLAGASLIIYFASPFIFRIWLGQDMPGTRAILPLVLCHTTLGGSAMIGRSILLATGRTTPFAVSVLIAGLTNVAASFVFVRYFHWGLAGIVAGTILAVVLRCVVWMPAYVLRTLKSHHEDTTKPKSHEESFYRGSL